MESLDEVTCFGHNKSDLLAAAACLSLVLVADDASGIGVVDDVIIPVLTIGAIIENVCNPASNTESIARAEKSISIMSTKTKDCRPGYVYHLVAKSDGMYPTVNGGTVYLKAGDTWKIGETTNGLQRYGKAYLTKSNLDMKKSSAFMTDKYQLWIEEKRQLIEYAHANGTLPPGNKLFK